MSGRPAPPPSGARHVVAYNWPMYAAAAAAVTTGVLAARRLPTRTLRVAARAGAAAAAWWSAASLAASHAVYDRSPLHGWRWLDALLPGGPGTHLVVTTGLDEASARLAASHPGARQTVADLYDSLPVVEPSLRRARRRVPPRPGTLPATPHWLPCQDGSQDTVLLPFAAHELRDAADREALFAEVARVLRPGGAAIVLEHCRDAANIAAFGPGAWHFMPRGEWLRLAARAGLSPAAERRIARLVRVLVLRKAPGR